MLRTIHLVAAVALLASHGTFLGRGLYLRRAGKAPAALDRAARSVSQLLLPLTAFIGLLGFRAALQSRMLLLHLLLGLAPLAAIILVLAGRVVLRRRTEAPWLLPAVNLALIAAAMATGFAASGP
jgi:hypothetical protein